MRTYRKLWLIMGILIILSPLGLFLPEWAKTGTPWGEWTPEELEELIGFLPRGLKEFSKLWKPFFSDYSPGVHKTGSYFSSGFRYMLSALLGAGLTVGASFILAKIILRKGERKKNDS